MTADRQQGLTSAETTPDLLIETQATRAALDTDGGVSLAPRKGFPGL
jgi:hypothetical protein